MNESIDRSKGAHPVPENRALAPLRGVSQVRNVVAAWGSFGLAAAAGLFMSPFIVHALGVAPFGVWVVISSMTGTLNLLDLGVKSAVTRLVAREHARSDHVAASRIASTARALFLGAGLVAVVVTVVLAIWVQEWFTIPPDLVTSARIVLPIAGLSLAVVLTTGLFGGILSAIQRLDVVGLSDIGLEILRIALVVTVLKAGAGIIGLSLVLLLLALSKQAIQHRASIRLYPELRLVVGRPRRDDVRAIVAVSAYSTLIYVSANVIAQASTIIIGMRLPVELVTFYAIAATLPLYAGQLNWPIAQTVQPRASRLEAVGDAEGLRRLVLDTSRYSALFVLPMAITFYTRGRTFLGIWMGPEFQGVSATVLKVLASGLLFSGTRHVMQSAFVGSGRHRSLGPWYVLEAGTVIALCTTFVTRWGIEGAAWAIVAPTIAMSVILFPVLLRRHFGISPMSLFLNVWARPILAMAPFGLLSVLADRFWSPTSYIAFFAQVLVALPVAALGALLVASSPSERVRATEVLKAFSRKLLGGAANPR